MGGAHTTSFVTGKSNGSDRYDLENLQHKYSKLLGGCFMVSYFKDGKNLQYFGKRTRGP
jgi:hypothetical protein